MGGPRLAVVIGLGRAGLTGNGRMTETIAWASAAAWTCVAGQPDEMAA